MKQINVGKTNECLLLAKYSDGVLVHANALDADVEIRYDRRIYDGISDIEIYIIGLANSIKQEVKEEVKEEVKKEEEPEESISDPIVEDEVKEEATSYKSSRRKR